MVDIISEEHRSWNMSRIRSKNTKPELIVRSLMHRMGFRFRLHIENLPGKPDIVLPKYKTVIFVNGCFWHQHPGCKGATMPKTRSGWWREKLGKNVIRDVNAVRALGILGYKVIIVWECETKSRNLKILNEKLCGKLMEGMIYSDSKT